MAHNPSTLSHVDCKEEEENLFSVSPSFSLSPFSHTTPGTRSNLFILINFIFLAQLLVLKKLGVLDRVFLFLFQMDEIRHILKKKKKKLKSRHI